ncbi:MAG: hypothetical protein IT337_12450 [Thermomicrobiales bacterium]|nr:hypothetical protein [Thermomicrobiales bacterium]
MVGEVLSRADFPVAMLTGEEPAGGVDGGAGEGLSLSPETVAAIREDLRRKGRRGGRR